MWQKCQIMCQGYEKLTFSQKQPGRFLSFWCHLIGTWGYLAGLIAIYLVHFVPTLQTFQARCVYGIGSLSQCVIINTLLAVLQIV